MPQTNGFSETLTRGTYRNRGLFIMVAFENKFSVMMEACQTQMNQCKSQNEKALSQEERERLENDKAVSQFKQEKLEKEALKNWDLFYKRNGTRFFKDRHWTTREFDELTEGYVAEDPLNGNQMKLLEIGSGVGNAIFPLLEENPRLFVYACDFSPRAIQYIKDNPTHDPERCHAFQCDVTVDDLTVNVPENSIDVVTMIFVLSAILPTKMAIALQNVFKALKPGGIILFRDYGMYDHAMLRFSKGHKLQDNFYARQDGTRAYFFSLEYTRQLFCDAGYDVITNEYVHRSTINKKEGIDVPRIFVQGKFRKKLNNS